jgi:Methyltransferase small domain
MRDIVPGFARRSIAYVYRRGVRPCLPGISICQDRKWGDHLVPITWVLEEVREAVHGDEPGYEAALVEGLSETVRSGDSVIIVGAGLGVTAVVAAIRAGPTGTVQCFEGSREYVTFVRQTATRNKVTNVSVHHAVVAKAISIKGRKCGRVSAVDVRTVVLKPPSGLAPSCAGPLRSH